MEDLLRRTLIEMGYGFVVKCVVISVISFAYFGVGFIIK